MAYILVKKKEFEETAFESEDELESAVVKNKDHIFGDSSILIDYKRKVGSKLS